MFTCWNETSRPMVNKHSNTTFQQKKYQMAMFTLWSINIFFFYHCSFFCCFFVLWPSARLWSTVRSLASSAFFGLPAIFGRLLVLWPTFHSLAFCFFFGPLHVLWLTVSSLAHYTFFGLLFPLWPIILFFPPLPAWTSSAGMLSTPADFPFFSDCTAASTSLQRMWWLSSVSIRGHFHTGEAPLALWWYRLEQYPAH